MACSKQPSDPYDDLVGALVALISASHRCRRFACPSWNAIRVPTRGLIEEPLAIGKSLTNILAELVGGLTLGRTRVEASTAHLFSNTLYTSAKLDYQGTGFRFAAPLHLKLLNKRCEGRS